MKILNQRAKKDKKRQKNPPDSDQSMLSDQSSFSQDEDGKSLKQLKQEMKVEIDLLEKSLSLESVSEGESMDFLEKNKVVLSLVPLKKAMVDETASVRESFKIQRNFKSTDKFFKPVLSIDGASTVSINSLAEIALEE